jgi:hypothetical protein
VLRQRRTAVFEQGGEGGQALGLGDADGAQARVDLAQAAGALGEVAGDLVGDEVVFAVDLDVEEVGEELADAGAVLAGGVGFAQGGDVGGAKGAVLLEDVFGTHIAKGREITAVFGAQADAARAQEAQHTRLDDVGGVAEGGGAEVLDEARAGVAFLGLDAVLDAAGDGAAGGGHQALAVDLDEAQALGQELRRDADEVRLEELLELAGLDLQGCEVREELGQQAGGQGREGGGQGAALIGDGEGAAAEVEGALVEGGLDALAQALLEIFDAGFLL